MDFFKTAGNVLAILLFICYAYQMYYIFVPSKRGTIPIPDKRKHSFAVLICARNEENVICGLLQSIAAQDYPEGLIHVFVMADNCTDRTADVARLAGATVYERQNKEKVGKGYALDCLLQNIKEDFPAGFDGYMVFDADNLLEPDFISRMDDVFSSGYDIVTSYRNSKNFGDNWVSAGYGLSFMRESRFLNVPRMSLSTSCAVSGTGFMFSRKVLDEMGGWHHYMLTEDIEFSIDQIVNGRRIGMAEDAVLYDEQPTSFRQSVRQRIRWSRGNFEVLAKYAKKLLGGIFRGEFACFDMVMAMTPAAVFTVLSMICNIAIAVLGVKTGTGLSEALFFLARNVVALYLPLFLIGALTTVSEWRKIHIPAWKKIIYCFTFPLFMLTYIPVAFVSLLPMKVKWKPIAHNARASSVPSSAVGQIHKRRYQYDIK